MRKYSGYHGFPNSRPIPRTGRASLNKVVQRMNQVKKPIHDLLYAWRKLKLESWQALLDEVQDQYEINAGKLWFSLYSVLRKRTSPDATEYKLSTIQIVEDFICTSSFGEFRKSLQLLFAFLGHIKIGVCLQASIF
ncbi:midasin-like [Rosa sericea]